jgi:hypothetical protein
MSLPSPPTWDGNLSIKENVLKNLSTWAGNWKRNTASTFSRIGPKGYIQLVIVIGAYALIIRPLVLKGAARVQRSYIEKEARESAAAIDPNDLRGGGRAGKIHIPGVDSDSDEERDEAKKDAKTGEWGRTARLRQRRLVRELLDAKERQEQEDESDEEIKEYLIN